ncbi:unnamed protein product [Spirodela intermedia]|uniref:Uncharacterized protein n=2 Tax=Spirodela intermedia TaxID=51605 RepID=A0A7I8K9A6_SPIIN|nr:unnamed protein product [Spirodela intermedia]CAA6657378.1 unnamed protein product [Spirodela intermedia]CAA7393430.1 unnamed protein product [Spirodela intermedia]
MAGISFNNKTLYCLFIHFGSSSQDNVHEQFFNLQQLYSVTEYLRDFEIMSGSVTDLSLNAFKDIFLKRLKLEIQTKIYQLAPIDLHQIM